MLNLESQKTNRNSRGRKYIKQSVCSFNKFQDFIVAKSKEKTPKPFFSDRNAMTGQIKIQKLNFTKTASDSQFLPPKSVDKFSRSSTNRNGFSASKQQFMMSQTQTPTKKTKMWSFESTNEEYLPRPQQIKAKIESNAMQRFQQLFKKQTSIRAKRIQEEQSKRLMKLLENTNRKNHDNRNGNRNVRESQNGYLNYGNVSKKKLSQEENSLTESTNLQRHLEEQSDLKIKAKQSINNPKMVTLTQKNKTIERSSQSQSTKKEKIGQSKKNNFFKERTSIDLGKQLKKKTMNIDECMKNTQVTKEQQQNIRKSLKKTEERVEVINSEVNQRNIQQKIQDLIIKSQKKGQSIQSQQVKESRNEQVDLSQKKVIKKTEKNKDSFKTIEKIQAQKKLSLKTSKDNNQQQTQIPKAVPQIQLPKRSEQVNQKKQKHIKPAVISQPNPREQFAKKNSFKVDQMDVFDHLPTAQVVQKPEPSIKQISKDNLKQMENNRKEQDKKEEQSKGKVSLDEIIKNKTTGRHNTQQSVSTNNNNNSLNKSKSPITIKGAKQVKSTKNEVNPQSSFRYTNEEDIDDLQEVSIVGKGGVRKEQSSKQQTQMTKSNTEQAKNSKSLSSNNQKEPIKSSAQNSNKNIKQPTQTSLAKEVQNNRNDNKGSQKLQPTNNTQSPSKSQTLVSQGNRKPQSQQKVEFNDSEQAQACPADQLGYLLDLVQTLGSYYTDSKHFYTQPDSSMIQILMNHKLSAYFLAQQYYFYIHLFKKFAQAQKKQEFYSLSPEEFQQALQDEEMAQGIEELKRSSQLAVKLIKMTFEKCKMYLKKHQKDLTISEQLNYHKQCVQYLRAEFSGLYKLYLDKTTSPLGKRLCYLIQTYGLVMYLNGEELKEYEDVQDMQPQFYTKHINKYKSLLGE